MEIIHKVVAGPDEVTGRFTTRCGLSSLRGAAGFYDLFKAGAEIEVTCPKCKLKLTATQKKILRLMYQNDRNGFYKPSKSFSYSIDRGLRMYGPKKALDGLAKHGLICYYKSSNTRYSLQINGALLARSLPEIKDEF